MADAKIKTAAGKCPLDLIPLRSLYGAARVSAYGNKKYTVGNWYEADDTAFTHRYSGALLRHVSEMQEPNGVFSVKSVVRLDEESGLPNIDHAIDTLLFLRGLLVKHGLLPADPGPGKEPPK